MAIRGLQNSCRPNTKCKAVFGSDAALLPVNSVAIKVCSQIGPYFQFVWSQVQSCFFHLVKIYRHQKRNALKEFVYGRLMSQI